MNVNRKKIKKDLIPMCFPKLPPENLVGDYMQSKVEERQVKKFPEWDNPRISPPMELVVARRKLAEADLRLTEKRNGSKARREFLDNEWKYLDDKEQQLKQSFIKFNKFVRENFEKRERAEKKIQHSIGLQEKRTIDIKELENKYFYMQDIKTSMEEHIKTYRIYEDYLTNVCQTGATFKSINEILDRYDAIIDARDELTKRQEHEMTALESARGDMMALLEEKVFAIMNMNNQVASLQSRYEHAKARALQWEAIVIQIKNVICELMAERHKVKTGVWNIYNQMCKRNKVEAKCHIDDVENQLLFVKATLSELERIEKIAKSRAQKELNASVAITSK